MFPHKTKVLLILSQEVLDRARVLAGRATSTLKLPVSLQIVLRAMIEEGLKRRDDPAVVANIAGQAEMVRHIRRTAPREARGQDGRPRPGPSLRRAGSRRPQTRRS
ncbi:MAG: hypothetical protein ACREJG_03295 [Candidatus Rokuibacteriota bacterium]